MRNVFSLGDGGISLNFYYYNEVFVLFLLFTLELSFEFVHVVVSQLLLYLFSFLLTVTCSVWLVHHCWHRKKRAATTSSHRSSHVLWRSEICTWKLTRARRKVKVDEFFSLFFLPHLVSIVHVTALWQWDRRTWKTRRRQKFSPQLSTYPATLIRLRPEIGNQKSEAATCSRWGGKKSS